LVGLIARGNAVPALKCRIRQFRWRTPRSLKTESLGFQRERAHRRIIGIWTRLRVFSKRKVGFGETPKPTPEKGALPIHVNFSAFFDKLKTKQISRHGG